MIFMMVTVLTACGNKETDTSSESFMETENLEDVVVTGEMGGQAADDTEIIQSGKVEEVLGENQDDIQEKDFSFAEFKNLNFTFLSGAGGWSTEMAIAEDGSFEGVYYDSDMGSNADSYPNGTKYYCSFHGKFAEPVQKEEYIYATTIESISYDNPAGTEEIKDGIRYIYADAYGLDDPQEILIYLPGIPIENLPEGYLSWVRTNWRMDYEFTKTETKLPFYGLYNENSEQGFSSYNIIDDLKNSLTYKEEWEASLESSILNDPLSQGELNEKSQEMYEIWDYALNEIWAVLKANLDADTMENLTEEQLEWIAWKEQDMKEVGAEVEGGSMYAMVVYQRGAKLTKDRVYELMEIVNELAEEF